MSFFGLNLLEYDSLIQLSITAGLIPPQLRHSECLDPWFDLDAHHKRTKNKPPD